MASSEAFRFTFLRGSGFLHNLVGAWDLRADETGQWPSQKGFVIFEETTLVAVIERHEHMRRGIEATYSVEGNRILMTELRVDTAPEQGSLGEVEFEIDGDMLTMIWLSTQQTGQPPVDRFQRRAEPANRGPLTQGAVYTSRG